MRYFALIFMMLLTFTANAFAEETDPLLIKRDKELAKYEKECFDKEAYPKGIDNYSMYNDDFKEADFRYHQCIKRIIVKKINEMTTGENARRMIAAIDKIQEGILDFYWILYNRQDNGVVGRMQNDAALGRYFESILRAIIHYQAVYESY